VRAGCSLGSAEPYDPATGTFLARQPDSFLPAHGEDGDAARRW